MGIKSTVELSREDAIRRLADLLLAQMRVRIEANLAGLPNVTLETMLERENDAAAQAQGFGIGLDNFLITE